MRYTSCWRPSQCHTCSSTVVTVWFWGDWDRVSLHRPCWPWTHVHLLFTTLWSRCSFCHHFTDKNIEAPRDYVCLYLTTGQVRIHIQEAWSSEYSLQSRGCCDSSQLWSAFVGFWVEKTDGHRQAQVSFWSAACFPQAAPAWRGKGLSSQKNCMPSPCRGSEACFAWILRCWRWGWD